MWQIARAAPRIYAAIIRALMHLATTAWLACHPLRCVPASRLAYWTCCCRQAVASSSQIGDRNVGRCSPLEGESSTPPRRRTKPGPQGPGFLLGISGEWRVANGEWEISGLLFAIRHSPFAP